MKLATVERIQVTVYIVVEVKRAKIVRDTTIVVKRVFLVHLRVQVCTLREEMLTRGEKQDTV